MAVVREASQVTDSYQGPGSTRSRSAPYTQLNTAFGNQADVGIKPRARLWRQPPPVAVADVVTAPHGDDREGWTSAASPLVVIVVQ